MFEIRFNKKGIVLLFVLGTLLVITSLAVVVLSLILSNARITHHQTSRIEAYYAALAGMNYAMEKLRVGTDNDWKTVGAPYTHNLCRSGCNNPGDITDPDLPNSIDHVEITVTPAETSTIRAKALYTYTTTP